MKRLAILGAGGHAGVVADIALLTGWTEVVFYDDSWPERASVGEWVVLGTTQALVRDHGKYDGVIVALGDNRVRLQRYRELVAAGATVVRLAHPSAVVSPRACVGVGTVVCACAVIGPFATVGEACIINTGATVDHDCVLDDAVHVSPGAHLGGGTRLGNSSWIGIGAAVRHGITIGSQVTVGAGAAVVNDIEDGMIVVGVPARPKGTIAK